MEVTLKTLNLVNFKGVRKLSISFDGTLTNIFGDNATGKTTVFDAFTWLLFGKNSESKDKFNIKNTADTSLNRQDHEVSAVLIVDGSELKLRRVFKENWVKTQGKTISEFKGNRNEFHWDDNPVNETVYMQKVSDILEESIFKLISNPLYFSTILDWKSRRAVLSNIAGNLTDNDIARGNQAYEALLAKLTNGKTLEEYKNQLSASKKLIKEKLLTIPSRIDEVYKNMPEEVDSDFINKCISDLQGDVTKIEGLMADRSSACQEGFTAIQNHQNKIHTVKTKINQVRFSVDQQVKEKLAEISENRRSILRSISSASNEKEQIERQMSRRQEEITAIESKILDLRAAWNTQNEVVLVFNDHEFTCPSCQRAYETDNIEEIKSKMTINFNNNKAIKLAEIVASGKKLGEELERLKQASYVGEISVLQNDINRFTIELDEFDQKHQQVPATTEEILSKNEEYASLTKQLQDLESSLPESPKVDLTDLQAQKSEVVAKIDILKEQLSHDGIIKANKKRIDELKEEEKNLNVDLAGYEEQEFTIDAFNKEKIETIEARINDKFKLVKFKMFAQQNNGGEKETCEAMVNDVPYADLNNAARINAGLDIINALCEFYGVHVPCFIDNAESITQLINVQSQIIRLIVSETDKKLRVA